jgi:mevalonate kinase
VTRAGLIALERGAHSELGELFNRNHELLCALGVSTPELNRRCATLRSNGALGAKLSGAGHGGVCFGLFERREAAEEALSAFGSETWVVEVGVASR